MAGCVSWVPYRILQASTHCSKSNGTNLFFGPGYYLFADFFISSGTFLILRFRSGEVEGIRFDPGFLNMDFNAHYKHVWLYDVLGAVLFGLFLERRWICRNMCFMGAICAAGASYSRLLPVVNTEKCNLCGKCEIDCLVRIPITDYIQENHGLVTNPECIICGKCIESCKPDAMKIKFIWNRKKYLQNKHETIN